MLYVLLCDVSSFVHHLQEIFFPEIEAKKASEDEAEMVELTEVETLTDQTDQTDQPTHTDGTVAVSSSWCQSLLSVSNSLSLGHVTSLYALFVIKSLSIMLSICVLSVS